MVRSPRVIRSVMVLIRLLWLGSHIILVVSVVIRRIMLPIVVWSVFEHIGVLRCECSKGFIVRTTVIRGLRMMTLTKSGMLIESWDIGVIGSIVVRLWDSVPSGLWNGLSSRLMILMSSRHVRSPVRVAHIRVGLSSW